MGIAGGSRLPPPTSAAILIAFLSPGVRRKYLDLRALGGHGVRAGGETLKNRSSIIDRDAPDFLDS
jgi:hypothetical protein